MIKLSRSSVEKKIDQITRTDEIVTVHARVLGTNPFIIEDETGTTVVKTKCTLQRGSQIRVIGYVSFKEDGALLEIDPIAVHDMGKFDYGLHEDVRRIKNQLVINQWHGK